MKRALALAFAFGVGAAVGAALVAAFASWWMGRPRRWDTSAVTAQFDSIDTEGSENKLVFYYTLENTTDRDFRIVAMDEVRLAGRLERQRSLTAQRSDVLSGEFPLFIPAQQRARFALHLGYRYKGRVALPPGNTKEERDREREILAAYVRDELTNLGGFVLFHEPTRYQIDLPSGWK